MPKPLPIGRSLSPEEVAALTALLPESRSGATNGRQVLIAGRGRPPDLQPSCNRHAAVYPFD